MTGETVLCSCGELMAELQAMPDMQTVLHHGAGVTGQVLGLFSLGT